MHLPVDLRSDTVTRPSAAMREAMASAEVGDDVLRDDPTVQELERRVAAMVGKEAALYVTSGTMGNELALMTHTRRGNEVICGRPCHIQEHEVGAAAILSAVTLVPIDAPTGTMGLDRIHDAIREPDIHHPETGLICVECAHSSGAVQDIAYLESVKALAVEAGLPVHMDGARLFNASIASGVPVDRIAACGDSVMFCLSKGMGAPVGSMLCGTKEFIERARKGRKILGGGMRQAGILAAAGLFALEHNVARLDDDHRLAERLAQALRDVPGLHVIEDQRDINIVWFRLDGERDDEALVKQLQERNVLVFGPSHGQWRLVTHMDLDEEAVEYAVDQLRSVLA
ncbi:MAG: low-specificity L-threonine aldolase [Deltaproteobacteria bacterium]|nr:low-specificity L-threonine aldolase [Deltaproteobacteria bacterium]